MSIIVCNCKCNHPNIHHYLFYRDYSKNIKGYWCIECNSICYKFSVNRGICEELYNYV